MNTLIKSRHIALIGIILLTLLLSLSLFSANLGTYKQNECVNIKTILNTTNVNISTISSPNSTLLVSNQAMTKQAYTFNYTFCNTTDLGVYVYDYFDAQGNVYVNDFEITATGKDLSSAKATSYVIIFIVSFLIFLGLLLIGIYLPIGNKRDEMSGYILAISNLKYFKLLCLALSYLIAMFISYFAWMVCYAYLDMDFVTNIFRFVFTTQAILVLPLFILFTYLTIANVIRDNKIGDMLSRGLRTRGDER